MPIQKIPANKATGLDNISAYLLKEAAPITAASTAAPISSGILPGR